MIQSDGTYKITTGTETGPKEGAPPGWYKVTVTITSGDPYAEASKVKLPTINGEYSSQRNTPLSVEVKDGAAPGAYDLKVKKV
jgi:hypothetical protein